MHIGIITSSVDILVLFRFLQKYDFVYTLFFDQEGSDWAEKDNGFVFKRVQKLLELSIQKGMDAVILPPMLELYFLQQEKYKEYILPLFTRYVLDVCLPFSRVGKIGIVGDYFDEYHQYLLKDINTTYILNDVQKNIKTFHIPFVYWFKNVRMWKYFVMQLGWKNRMMHNILKHDIRILLDAGVDTIIPCNYGYFAYDVTIHKYLRTKKIYWHGLKKMENVFENVCSTTMQDLDKKQGEYAIHIVYTGHIDHLLGERKICRLLQQGKKYNIHTEKIDI